MKAFWALLCRTIRKDFCHTIKAFQVKIGEVIEIAVKVAILSVERMLKGFRNSNFIPDDADAYTKARSIRH